MKDNTLIRIYVWELPVRFYHWINFACIVILVMTGFTIGNPPALQNASEAWTAFWFGKIRFIHFTTAYIFLFNFLFRIYWGFVGNPFSDWRNFIIFNKKQVQEIKDVLKIDILQMKGKPIDSIGHNALAGFTYFLTFLAFLFQVFTGFGLYSRMSEAFIPRLFSWVVPVMGGEFALRQWHHFFMWFFIIFSLVHVYLVFYHDYVEGRGVISSMVGGWKFIESENAKIPVSFGEPSDSYLYIIKKKVLYYYKRFREKYGR